MNRLFLLLFVFTSFFAQAHEIGLSNLDVEVGSETILAKLAARHEDLAAAMRSGQEVDAAHAVEVRIGNAVLEPDQANQEREDDTSLRFVLRFKRPAGAGSQIGVRCDFFEGLPPGHRQLVTIKTSEGRKLFSEIVSAKNPQVEISLDAPPQSAAVNTSFGGFLRLGMEHIFTGYDHLLFLFGLLLVCGSFGSAIRIVTSFTVAHSLTLALATLGWVNLSSRIVEPAIAASIVFVGVENLLRNKEPHWRWLLTFGFGLIHGLGFATALRELGVGVGDGPVAMPLVAFNVGVELGQMTVVAVVLPILMLLRRRAVFPRYAVPAGSVLIVIAGAFWMVTRLMGVE